MNDSISRMGNHHKMKWHIGEREQQTGGGGADCQLICMDTLFEDYANNKCNNLLSHCGIGSISILCAGETGFLLDTDRLDGIAVWSNIPSIIHFIGWYPSWATSIQTMDSNHLLDHIPFIFWGECSSISESSLQFEKPRITRFIRELFSRQIFFDLFDELAVPPLRTFLTNIRR